MEVAQLLILSDVVETRSRGFSMTPGSLATSGPHPDFQCHACLATERDQKRPFCSYSFVRVGRLVWMRSALIPCKPKLPVPLERHFPRFRCSSIRMRAEDLRIECCGLSSPNRCGMFLAQCLIRCRFANSDELCNSFWSFEGLVSILDHLARFGVGLEFHAKQV